MSIRIDEVVQGARILHLLPVLEDEIARMDRALVNGVFQKIRDGALTPEMAMTYWQEKFAYDTLLRRMKQKASTGQALGEKFSKEMNYGQEV